MDNFYYWQCYSVIISIGTSCAAEGHTNGCCQGSISACTVVQNGLLCYCDEGCHATGECCSDIKDIGCLGEKLQGSVSAHIAILLHHAATTCGNAGLSPGNCRWSSANCHTGVCYCDRACRKHNDCCRDVPTRTLRNREKNDIDYSLNCRI